jgi:hypothetical protein
MKNSRLAKSTIGDCYPAILSSLLKEVSRQIQDMSKCQSIAIRLNEKGDFPYYVHVGFPDFFITKENSLNVKDEKGERVLAADGEPFVECMCGNVLKGRFNPASSFFTKSGAFWTNSTTQLLNSLSEKEKQEAGKTRNTCHEHGYESVALIPIHSENKIIGLLQINDPRENRFTIKSIEKYQSLADHVGAIIINLMEFYRKAKP